METLWKTILDWLIRRLPAFLVRGYWTEDRLRSRLLIDVRPRGDVLQLNGGDPSEVSVYVRIWNMLPFAVEIDRIAVTVWCNQPVCQPLQHLERVRVASFGIADAHVLGGQGINLEKQFGFLERIPQATITIRADVNSAVRRFEVRSDDVCYVWPVMYNVSNDLRQKLYK